MNERGRNLKGNRQLQLLQMTHSPAYRQPVPEPTAGLALMRKIYEIGKLTNGPQCPHGGHSG